MGDRANCIVLQNNYQESPPVWLYTHWHGSDLLQLVQNAIRRRVRWDDSPYLTRIVFDAMTAGLQGNETGFGITTCETDNSHDFVVVDPNKQEVRIEAASGRAVVEQWSFAEFCEIDTSTIKY